MKKYFSFLVVSLFSFLVVFADEGMWVPIFLKGYPIEQMHAKGFKLSADDIYSVNHSSLKDAIMQFGGGCTASLISPDGLVLTNHHCGYSSIVNHSTVEHDYLTNGFWAPTMADELPNPGLTAKFLVYMEDVTQKVLSGIPESLKEAQRQMYIARRIRKITDSVEKHWDGQYVAEIKPFYYGNQYILIVSQVFKDVRLVGAPPSAIGKFGGETDNWMWPRHTGDFSLFRIYVDKNNKPAEYSPDNVPYRPKRFLKISLKGYKQGDFTMIFGYPGRTQEYVPSYTVNNVMNSVDPWRINIRQAKLDILMPALNDNPRTRLMYAKEVARIANAWKKWQGEIKGLRRLQAIKKKKDFEQKFEQWTLTPEGGKYAGLLDQYKDLYDAILPYQKAFYYYVEVFYYSGFYRYANNIISQLDALAEATSPQDFQARKEKLNAIVTSYLENHRIDIEVKLMNKLLGMYKNDLDSGFVPQWFYSVKMPDKQENVACQYGLGNVIVNSSVFYNKEEFDKVYNKLEYGKRKNLLRQLGNDGLLTMALSVREVFKNKVQPYMSNAALKLDSLNRLYMKAQMEFQPQKHFYPDANSTLRVAFGTVGGYKPADAVYYDYFTTLEGIIEKDDPDVYDYDVPQRLKELYEQKDYGPYADSDGTLHVAFIANNHTTGGNSGSPVLDANGNLIGLNFDRTWESTMSDLMYDPDRCRNIMVDIRYILFLVDKYAGAKRLVDEMVFVD